MRTTVTLDPDVNRLIDDSIHRSRKSFKEVINNAIRSALSRNLKPPSPRRFRVVPHSSALRPGFDPAGFNKLADELEDAAVVEMSHRKR